MVPNRPWQVPNWLGADLSKCRFDYVDRCRNDQMSIWPIPTEHARLTNSKVNLKHKHLFITGCSNSKLSTITDHEKSKGHWVWLWVWTKSQFYNCYQDNSPGCVTNLLNSLQWESLQQRRWKQTLVMCYKIHHQLIAIEPANYYTAGDSRTRGNHRLGQIRAKKDTYIPSSRDPSGNGTEYHLQL